MSFHAVERAGQAVGVDAGLGAEFGEVGRWREPIRGRLAGRDAEEAVALEMKRVEDDPRRVVRVAVAWVEVLERACHRVVLACLVEEPLACPVDDDASRAGSFEPDAAAARLALEGVARESARSAPTRLRPCSPGRRRAPSPSAGRRRCCSAVTPRRASARAGMPRPALQSHSNPPSRQDDATLERERGMSLPSWVIRTPVMPRGSAMSSTARAFVRGVTPTSSRPFSSPAISAVPATQ